ncbi:mitochondrial ubiquitin ligase activator of nfkb 1-like [Centruroides vittatus]|uniref:mitochondrial ubiquitin ligase activator of nfkb 1-like n=1 Tax=Centruroides vittatus TaxID=120091 RepID=UPI00350FC8D4
MELDINLEPLIIELVCLGFDIACFTLFYTLYNKGKKNVEEMKAAPILEIDKNLKSTVSSYENAVIPYGIIRGNVQSKSIPLRSTHVQDVTGVIKKIAISEYKVMWSPVLRFWSETKHDIKSTLNAVPFVLKNESSWQKAFVDVEEPFSCETLPLTTVYDQFTPVEQNFGSTVIGWLRGERTKGFQELEEMLLEGTVLTGIGKITIENNVVKLKPPSDGLSYYLTAMSKETVLRKLNDDVKFLRAISILSGVVGVFLITWITKSLYTNWKRKFERERDARRREELRRTRNRYGVQEERPNAPTCVVCLTNSVEMMILECGHACLCADCAEEIERRRQCPVCRSTITRVVTTFLP